MDLGAFVREKRRMLKISQTELAARAGVGLNFVYQLEKNKPKAQLDCVQRVLTALGYTLTVSALDEGLVVPDIRAGATCSESTRRPLRLPWD